MAISIPNSKEKNNNCKEQIEQAIEEKPEGTNPIQMKGKKITSAKQEPTLPSISKSRPKKKGKANTKQIRRLRTNGCRRRESSTIHTEKK